MYTVFNTLYTLYMYMCTVKALALHCKFRQTQTSIEIIDRLTVEWGGGSLIAVVLPGQELLQDCSRPCCFPVLALETLWVCIN